MYGTQTAAKAALMTICALVESGSTPRTEGVVTIATAQIILGAIQYRVKLSINDFFLQIIVTIDNIPSTQQILVAIIPNIK